MRGIRRVAILVVSALCLSGCTLVSTSSSPSLVDPATVPLGLLGLTIPFTPYAQVRWVTRDIYLIAPGQRIVAIPRSMTAPPTLAAVLYYETQGPTPTEMAAGLTSQVPSNLVINQADIQGHVASIDVSKVFNQISTANRRIAVGQLVFAAAAMGATKGIQISVEGLPFTLTLASGAKVKVITPALMAYLKKG